MLKGVKAELSPQYQIPELVLSRKYINFEIFIYKINFKINVYNK